MNALQAKLLKLDRILSEQPPKRLLDNVEAQEIDVIDIVNGGVEFNLSDSLCTCIKWDEDLLSIKISGSASQEVAVAWKSARKEIYAINKLICDFLEVKASRKIPPVISIISSDDKDIEKILSTKTEIEIVEVVNNDFEDDDYFIVDD